MTKYKIYLLGLIVLLFFLNLELFCRAENTITNQPQPNKTTIKIANDFNLSPELLNAYSINDNPEIRAGVALNQKTSPKTLKRLSKDSDRGVVLNVAKNFRTPKSILKKLSKNKDKEISESAKKTLSSIALMKLFGKTYKTLYKN